MDANVLAGDLTFSVRAPPRLGISGSAAGAPGRRMFTAKNPPYGAILNYYLKEAVPAETSKTAKTESEAKDEAAPGETTEGGCRARERAHRSKSPSLEKKARSCASSTGPPRQGSTARTGTCGMTPMAEPTEEQKEAIAAGFSAGPRGPLVDPGEPAVLKMSTGAERSRAEGCRARGRSRANLHGGSRRAPRRHRSSLRAGENSGPRTAGPSRGSKDALTAARDKWKADASKPDIATKIPDDIRKAADELQKRVDAVALKFVPRKTRPGQCWTAV